MPNRKGQRPKNANTVTRKGRPNKSTVAAKAAFEHAFAGLGGVPGLIAWAKKNRTEFYKLYARLIPANLKVELPALPLADGPVVTVEQATEIYRRVMGDPAFDIAQITFAPPSARTSADNTPQTGDLSQPHPDSGYGAPAVDVAFTEVPAPTDPTNVIELSERQRQWVKLGQ
jgi:hypothetical protein